MFGEKLIEYKILPNIVFIIMFYLRNETARKKIKKYTNFNFINSRIRQSGVFLPSFLKLIMSLLKELFLSKH